MSRRVFVHVGLPKSGTSYLQRLLGANRNVLRKQARLWFPGPTWEQQVLAVRDLRGLSSNRRTEGAWARLARRVTAWDGDTVISMEWLCAATEDEIQRLLTDLAPARIEVVFTARDLGRTLTAAWQEFVQNRSSWPWDEFLESVVVRDGRAPGSLFWAQQDLPGLVARWGKHVPVDRLHVVTVPPPSAPPRLLWDRFAEVLDVRDVEMTFEQRQANESLGLQSTELMRRLNSRTRGELPRPDYINLYKHTLAKGILAARRPDESTLVLPQDQHAWVQQTAQEHIDAVRHTGVPVVGDLEELRPSLRTDGRQPTDLADGEVLDAALTAITGLADRLRQEQQARRQDARSSNRDGARSRSGRDRSRLLRAVRPRLARLVPRRTSTGGH